MTQLKIENLHAGYGSKMILNDFNLEINQGEMIALLGPSGCGKTTLLNALCGFVPASHGEIYVGDRVITKLPAEKRNITMVFQSYALWPHLTVAQNIGYGLKVRKVKTAEIQDRVNELLVIVKLEGLQNEKVTSLSGGQRQRVALARALAIRPDVLVLDEPLSNLDAKVRLNVRHEIKSLQKQLGFTSLIVTHDQEEALVMADRIAVLNQGKIEQLGTPEEIYRTPSSAFVANFMGAENHIEWQNDDNTLPAKSAQQIYFRSESVQVTVPSEKASSLSNDVHFDSDLTCQGHVLQSAFFGHHYRISVRCGAHTIQADHHSDLPENTPVTLRVTADALHIYNNQVETAAHHVPTSFQSNK
ncbi:ABC transporter ATP-binding protein [Marinomonas flavescens]|uniref:ABC transporter ATP-binding protein n=1 Tax=Marinomonas flavescens TaxID=2529379 RepID=UPI001056C686|nr:ABC transporter ATP-binding protein [Marinomonas flavescens]